MKRLLRSNLFRRCWTCGLGLTLGLAASRAAADDIEWRAASDAKPPAAAAAARGPAVTILAPVPRPAGAPAAPDPFRKVSFTGGDSESRVIFRAQMSDAPKMLPVGAPEGPEDPPTKKKADALPPPRVLTVPPGVTSGGPVITGAGSCGDPCACNPCPCPACGPLDWLKGHFDGCGLFGCHEPGDVDDTRFWVSAEYLLWWIKGDRLPPLVTTGNPNVPGSGAIPGPGTVVLFGGREVGSDPRSGARLRVGWWFDDEHTLGIEGSGFFLASRSSHFAAASPDGSMVLLRPFFNPGVALNNANQFVAGPAVPDAEMVSFPQSVAGGVLVNLQTRLWGAEANLRTNIAGAGWYNIDALAGFRTLELDETLDVTENPTTLNTPLNNALGVTPGVTSVLHDHFGTRNQFYGGQVGLDSELRLGRWYADVLTKVALGDVQQTVNINGTTQFYRAVPGGTVISPVQAAGLLAAGTNSGRYRHDTFAVLPELGVNVGYHLTDNLRVFVGYNALYLSKAVRPGEQIDPVVNPSQVPVRGGVPGSLVGPARPLFVFRETDFWAQGVNVGLEFRY